MLLERPTTLTPRETQVVRLLWDGLTNREIARRLKISIKTVETHRATIMKKWRARNAAQLLLMALRDGLVTVTERGSGRRSGGVP